ncbi:glycosyltransferase 87 family protein [Actinomyces sp. MRS3W]|uniref:glycosyltransferase 87 family protein n=1 Tax=Actinomyces sp. MRS3W TaxID=2800796 RepID=UPI0028FD3B67|nr:glycosyltransferase 87 family protein [Actinomyces sp. MRS3W]MDU0349708.1 glycosyltransferase 87 family protein [Actinomyces sp. MRS3W]
MESLKRALVSPAAALIGWVALALSIYPTLWGKDGSAIFKLDAWIYHHAVTQWHAGGSLYEWYANPAQQLWPFTYSPFAAWVFTPLTWWPDRATQVALVVATPVCTAITAWAVLHALGAARRVAWGAAPWLALGAVLLLEPVPKTMEYGQINAVLMMLVALDLLVVPASSRLRGVLAGLAAAFKLTPAIAVLVFLARRDWRGAATMVGSALGTTALCWLISPRESAQFFFSAMWDSSRAGFTDYSGNQNLKGLVARWLPEQLWDVVWGVLVVAAVAAAWLLLVRLNRLRPPADARPTASSLATVPSPTDAGATPTTDNPSAAVGASNERPIRTPRAPGFPLPDGVIQVVQTSVAMVLGLLVSPISWSHHWVWCLPALMGLVAAGLAWATPSLLVAAATGAAVFGLAMQWWFPEQNHVEQGWPFWATVVGSSYTWWALATGVVLWRAAGALARRRAHPAGVAGGPRTGSKVLRGGADETGGAGPDGEPAPATPSDADGIRP